MTRSVVGGLVLGLLVAVTGGACASAQKEKPAMEMELECSMSVAPRVRAGEPVLVRFQLTNPTSQPVYVLNWQTPLDDVPSNSLEVTRDGVEIPYQGPMFKRGDPEAEDYVAIAPGASASAEVEVSLPYEMREPGRYRIAFRNQLLDVTAQQAEVPRPRAQHRAVTVRCPAVETSVVPAG